MSAAADPAVTIRQIGTADWRLLRDIRLRALTEAPLSFGSSLAREAAYYENEWVEHVRWARWYLAFTGCVPVGVIGGLYDLEGLAADEVHLTSFWVDPVARRLGIGSSLLRAVVDWARDSQMGLISLWVSDRSQVAGEFYLRHGFVPTGDRQSLPSEPSVEEDKMCLDLTGPTTAGRAV